MEAYHRKIADKMRSSNVFVEYATQNCSIARLFGFQYKRVYAVIHSFRVSMASAETFLGVTNKNKACINY